MMDLKLLCYLVHCWHRILMLFHFGRMYSFRNRNCYLNCYCNQKIFHFGRVLRILCSHSLPRCWIGFPFGVDGLSGVSPSLWVTSSLELVPVPVSESISLWEGVAFWEVTIFSTIIFGYCTVCSLWEGVRVGNEQCIWWWCRHSYELGIGPMVLLGGSLQIGGFL